MSLFEKNQNLIFDFYKKHDWFLNEEYEKNNSYSTNDEDPNLYLKSLNLMELDFKFNLSEDNNFLLNPPDETKNYDNLKNLINDNSIPTFEKIDISNKKNISTSEKSLDKKDCIGIEKMIFEIKPEQPPLNSNTNLSLGKKNPNSCGRKYFRVDDAKKHFKVAISQFATEEINSLIKNSNLPKKFKKKIHCPNFKLFTSNPKELDNLEFLSFTLEQVFIYGKKENNLQARNEENIFKIINYKKYPEKAKNIKDFLSMKYEDIISLFYKSEKFQKFKNSELTRFFNDGIKKEKHISLLEENGLVKLFQMTKKKRKRENSSVLI